MTFPRSTTRTALACVAMTTLLGTSVAFAVPAGGYADLVETVSPSGVFIEVTTEKSGKGRALKEQHPRNRRKGWAPGS